MKLNKEMKAWGPFLIGAALSIGILIGIRINQETPIMIVDKYNENESSHTIQYGGGRVEEVLNFIQSRYVDDINPQKLEDAAIKAMLEQLDPHSSYISKDQLVTVNESLSGKFSGIGVEFFILDDTIMVVSALSGGPSEAVGIQAGDKIIMVEDSTIAGVGITSLGVADLLKGDKGTKVNVGIRRGDAKELLNFEITRDEIPLYSVDAGYMINDETGYIKVNRFSGKTYEEFMKKMETMIEKEGMKHLILDLRQNPGGYLQEATKILNQLFNDKGELLVYTDGTKIGKSEYKTRGRPFYQIGHIAVLIDEGSASASEIVAGAIQDDDRGIIVGRRSFGKGLVQEQYPLSDGSALRLTVARYYTPSGRSIQKPYDDKAHYDDDFINRLEAGELSSEEDIEIGDTTQYYTKKGDVVFGGGGVIPDIFVPIDTSFLSEDYINARQYLPDFVFRYLEKHDHEFSYGNVNDLIDNYTVSDEVYNAYLNHLNQSIENFDPAKIEAFKGELQQHIKARIARKLFNNDAFYAVFNQEDPMVKEALQYIQQQNPVEAARLDNK